MASSGISNYLDSSCRCQTRKEACITPTIKRVKVLSPPQKNKPWDNMRKDKVKPKKVQLTEQSKAALSESKLAKMWAKQVTTKTEETNSRGLKRKLFNLEGSVRKAGRVDTICVCPCVC